jgi:hypothetical protein
MGYLKHADVIDWIRLRDPSDNPLELDTLEPEDIANAMRSAAREYNSIPPLVGSVTADQLSDETNLFLDAIAEQLYRRELAKLTRKDVDYTAGGVSTNLVTKRITHLENLIKDHNARFVEAARNIKVARNLRSAYRIFR